MGGTYVKKIDDINYHFNEIKQLLSSEGEAISKNSERCILDLAGKVCETSHKYPKLSPVEKAEVEQYLRITIAGGCGWLGA